MTTIKLIPKINCPTCNAIYAKSEFKPYIYNEKTEIVGRLATCDTDGTQFVIGILDESVRKLHITDVIHTEIVHTVSDFGDNVNIAKEVVLDRVSKAVYKTGVLSEFCDKEFLDTGYNNIPQYLKSEISKNTALGNAKEYAVDNNGTGHYNL